MVRTEHDVEDTLHIKIEDVSDARFYHYILNAKVDNHVKGDIEEASRYKVLSFKSKRMVNLVRDHSIMINLDSQPTVHLGPFTCKRAYLLKLLSHNIRMILENTPSNVYTFWYFKEMGVINRLWCRAYGGVEEVDIEVPDLKFIVYDGIDYIEYFPYEYIADALINHEKLIVVLDGGCMYIIYKTSPDD